MFAIQSGTKFIKVEYHIDPTEVWNVVVSAKPKTYKTQAEAQLDLDRMIQWLERRAERAQEIITSSEAFVATNKKKVETLKAKLEVLLDMPFREVEHQVKKTRGAIERAADEVRYREPTIISYKKDLVRYTKIMSTESCVVKVKQTVEAL